MEQDVDVGEWYRFVDLDRDGLWDLLGESRFSLVRAWRNTGTASVPKFTMVADTLLDAGALRPGGRISLVLRA